MLSYNHHRHTSKATLHGKPVFRERALRLKWLCLAHVQGITDLQKKKKKKHTARKSKSVTLLSNATAGIVAYAHGSTNPIKIVGRLTEAMG